jgi:hypothetical protein
VYATVYLQSICSLFALFALVLAPGDLIELRGTAVYECDGALMESSAMCRLAVGSPAYSQPVYIPRPGPAAAGVTRVWWQRVGGGCVQLRGVQLSDGRVLTEFGDVVDLATSGGVL